MPFYLDGDAGLSLHAHDLISTVARIVCLGQVDVVGSKDVMEA